MINAGWVGGFLLIGLAGRSARSASTSLESPGTEHPLAVLVPYAALVLALLVSVVDFLRDGERSPRSSRCRPSSAGR